MYCLICLDVSLEDVQMLVAGFNDQQGGTVGVYGRAEDDREYLMHVPRLVERGLVLDA